MKETGDYYLVRLYNDNDEDFKVICKRVTNVFHEFIDDHTNTILFLFQDMISGKIIKDPFSCRLGQLFWTDFREIKRKTAERMVDKLSPEEKYAYINHINSVKKNTKKINKIYSLDI